MRVAVPSIGRQEPGWLPEMEVRASNGLYLLIQLVSNKCFTLNKTKTKFVENWQIVAKYLNSFLLKVPGDVLLHSLLICQIKCELLFCRWQLLTDLASINVLITSGVTQGPGRGDTHYMARSHYTMLRFWSVRTQRADTFSGSIIKTEPHTFRPVLNVSVGFGFSRHSLLPHYTNAKRVMIP